MDAIELGAGLVLAALVLFDVFQAVVVPRPITTPIGIARYVVRLTWGGWRDTFSGVTAADKRERYLGVYAPAILIFLLALWIVGVRDWRVFGAVLLWEPVLMWLLEGPIEPWMLLLLACSWRWRAHVDATLRSSRPWWPFSLSIFSLFHRCMSLPSTALKSGLPCLFSW